MAGLMNRFLAAIGIGGRKTEADVSYDPAPEDNTAGGMPGITGGMPGPGGSYPEEGSGDTATRPLPPYDPPPPY